MLERWPPNAQSASNAERRSPPNGSSGVPRPVQPIVVKLFSRLREGHGGVCLATVERGGWRSRGGERIDRNEKGDVMSTASVARKVAAKRPKCVECGAPLSAHRLRWRAITCSAGCGQARQRGHEHKPPRRQVKDVKLEPPPSPTILDFTLKEAAERLGISKKTAHNLFVKHGVGRLDGRRWWLTLTELRTLTVQPWRESNDP